MQHDSEVKKRGGMGKGGQEGRRRRRSGRGGGGRTEAGEGEMANWSAYVQNKNV